MSAHLNKTRLFSRFLCFLFCCLTGQIALGQKKTSVDTLYAAYAKGGIKGIQETYQALNPDNFDLGRFQVLKLGEKIRDEGNKEDALEVFLMNTELFPDSFIPFYNYGDLVNEIGDKTKAIAAYRRGLENLEKNESLSAPEQYYFSTLGKWGIKKIEHLNLTEKTDFTYYTYHGGKMAGWWDTENMVKFKQTRNLSDIHYKNFDIYATPVPKKVEKIFQDSDKPDVCGIFNGWVYSEHMASGEIISIDSLWEAEGWDRLFPESIRRAVTYNGKKYLVPQAFQFNPIYYRKHIFDSLGISPPATWNDLLGICEKIHQAGLTPFTISAKGWPPPVARWFTILNLRVNGFDFHWRLMKGKETWTDEKVKTVFDYWKQLFEHHAFAEGSENNSWNAGSQEFYSGKAVMYNIGEWIFENYDKDKLLNDVDFFTVPTINDQVETAEIFHLYGTMLLKKGKKNPNATQFLNVAASKESQGDNHKILETRTPSNIELYDRLSVLQKKQYDYIRGVEHLVPLFEFNPHPEFAAFALKKFLAFWEDQNDPDKILIELEDKRKQVFLNVD